MAKSKLTDVLGFLLPKLRGNPAGTGVTNTFNPTAAGQPLGAPAYREHLEDILTSRIANDSLKMIQDLIKFDPDVSAAVNAYLTVANQRIKAIVYDQQGELNPEGQVQLQQLLQFMTGRNDYTLGFQMNKSIYGIADEMRYMILMRGAVATELVVDKNLLPTEFRLIDPKTIQWVEDAPGLFKPHQIPPSGGGSGFVDLDIPTFFMAWYRKDPTAIYGYSPFVSVINTVAARQQVVNDLYRIMQRTGYPRLHVKVLEEILRKSAPEDARLDKVKMAEYVNGRLNELKGQISNLRVDDVFVSTDAVEGTTLNADTPGMAIDISSVIDVLNAQNQAALKTMATLLGRGTSGVNTASVEAMVFAMNADSLNEPVAEILGNLLTMMMRLQGFQGYVDVEFEKVELRPELELEPQRALKQARMLELLSLGLISDDYFHLEMFGRPKPKDIQDMSGTSFQQVTTGIDPTKVSPNNDPMGRSVTPEGGKAAGGNAVTSTKKSRATIQKKK